MRFTDVFSAEAVAFRQTSNPSNAIAFLGEQFFPTRRKMGIDLKWIKTHKGLGVALKPSALDSLATIRPRGGFQTIAEQMPFFRESMMITEQDEADIQRARESNDPYLNDVLANIFNDTDELIDGARIAKERMRMALLAPLNGDVKITVGMADNTLYNYDYDPNGEWKAEHYEELSGDNTWDNAETATPLNDIQEAAEALTGLGVAPTYAIMNSVTFNYLVNNKQIQAFSTIQNLGISTSYLDKNSVKAIFTAQTSLVPLIYDKQYKDYDGTANKYFPDDYVTIVGNEALGNTWCGVTPEERTLMGDSKVDVSVLDDGIAIAVKTEYGPPVQHSTTASQICLPSFEGMDSIYTIKVK